MAPASVVYIARHGERIDHVDDLWKHTAKNPYDAYLTKTGLAQARALGKHLRGKQVSHIFASPFYRTVQTANQVAEEIGVVMKIEPGLGEYLNEEWFDHAPGLRSIEELKSEFPLIDTSYVPQFFPQYPESRDQVIVRTTAVARLLAQKFSGRIVLIAHGMTCEFTARGLTFADARPYISYCSLQTCFLEEEDGKGGHYRFGEPSDPDISFMPVDIQPAVEGKITK